MGKSLQIIAYVTGDEKRVLGGDPLTLLVKDENAQKEIVSDLGRALRANVVQLKCGDYVLLTEA